MKFEYKIFKDKVVKYRVYKFWRWEFLVQQSRMSLKEFNKEINSLGADYEIVDYEIE